MLNAFLAAFTPLLLVFGLYHLMTWFDVLRINQRVYWKRVGLVCAIAHFLLVTGFLLFAYVDLQMNRTYTVLGISYSTFLFRHSAFFSLMQIFDTLPMLGVLALFSLMDRAGASDALLLPLTLATTYVLGTLQWYFVGGGIGLVVERIWEGLKTGEDGEEWFQ